jgi:hypothetical protein
MRVQLRPLGLTNSDGQAHESPPGARAEGAAWGAPEEVGQGAPTCAGAERPKTRTVAAQSSHYGTGTLQPFVGSPLHIVGAPGFEPGTSCSRSTGQEVQPPTSCRDSPGNAGVSPTFPSPNICLCWPQTIPTTVPRGARVPGALAWYHALTRAPARRVPASVPSVRRGSHPHRAAHVEPGRRRPRVASDDCTSMRMPGANGDQRATRGVNGEG